MQPTKELQETLYQEMLGRIKQTDLSVPSRIGDHLYYSRTEEGKQYRLMCRRKGGMDAPEEVLLDLNALAQGLSYLGVGAYVVSDDGHWLAYSTRHDGLPPVHAAREGSADRPDARASRSSGSALSCGRPTTGRFSTRPKMRSRSDPNKMWRHVRRRSAQRAGVRGERRAVRRQCRPLPRPEDDLLRLVREDIVRAAVPGGRQPGRRLSGSSCRGRPGTSTMPTTTRAGSTSAPTKARRTSGS